MNQAKPSRYALVILSLLLHAGCSSSSDDDAQPASANNDAGSDAASDGDVGFDSGDASNPPDDGATPPDDAPEDAAEEDGQPPCTPLDPSPGVGPGGYLLDGWTWTRHGVVLDDPSASAQGGYIAPAAVVLGGAIHLWVTRKEGVVHRILHSMSTDGETFSEPVATTGIEGQDIVAYPSVLHDGSRFLMWYGSGSIDHAQSQDGVSWTMIGTGVLKTGEAGAFDSFSLLYPNVIATPTGYVMHYTGYDLQAFGIGRAESADGIAWTRTADGAVIAKGAASQFDNHAAAQPCAFALGSRVLLWYGGYDTSVANPGPYRIGLAESVDGLVYDRKGVTLDLEASGTEAWSTRDPAVVRWDGKWWMAYSAMGDDGIYRIAVATSDTCADE
jgi:hypothetical protein